MALNDGAPTESDSMVAVSPDEPVAATNTPSVDTELIRGQLRDKEQLVTALTERLEQAAEQLDRLRRTGADKGRRPLAGGGGGMPAELVEDHKTTLEDLKRVIARWEDIQAEASFGRIETQISELRDLLVSAGGSPRSISASSIPTLPAAREKPADGAAPRSAETSAPRPGAKGGGNAWWEAQKAALMGEPVPAEAQAALNQPTESAPAAEATHHAATDHEGASTGSVDPATLNIPDLPAPVNLDEITLDEAREAIRERDRLIQKLREPLLLIQAAAQRPAGMQSLADLPEPLKQRIAELEKQWQSKFRQVELDLSLERARLAREQATVSQQLEVMQKQPRKGPTQAKPASGPEAGGKDDDGASKRRWFKFMGTPGETGETGDGQGT
jgi:hypothetical protein